MPNQRDKIELDYRESLIDLIEAHTGALETLQYHLISTDELRKLTVAIINKD